MCSKSKKKNIDGRTFIRVGGLCNLPCPDSSLPLEEQTLITREKGNKPYPVRIFPCTAAAIRRWCLDQPPQQHKSFFLIPAMRHRRRAGDDVVDDVIKRIPISRSHMRARFRSLCMRAGIRGSHAHIHTTDRRCSTHTNVAASRTPDTQWL